MGDQCNRDNFMGDKSSTRLYTSQYNHHSKSQWSFDWSAAPEKGPVSSNRFANGSNQNAGNVISERPTTLLHAPPGGFTSDIFGTNVLASEANAGANYGKKKQQQQQQQQRQQQQQQSIPPVQQQQQQYQPPQQQQQQQQVYQAPSTSARTEEANVPIVDRTNVVSNQYAPTQMAQKPSTSSFNSFDKKPSQSVQPVQKRGTSANAFANGSNQNAGNFITDRPTTKVVAPPGGRSSIFFG